jgi:hypothetical protein
MRMMTRKVIIQHVSLMTMKVLVTVMKSDIDHEKYHNQQGAKSSGDLKR